MPSIAQQLEDLQTTREKLLARQDKMRSNRTFDCVCCDSKHKIKECLVMQTYWYTPPHGCTGGDQWNTGELQIVCPKTDDRNRVLFTDHYHMIRDTSMSFARKYKHLFKEIVDDYTIHERAWENNYYFERNRKKFELPIKEVKK